MTYNMRYWYVLTMASTSYLGFSSTLAIAQPLDLPILPLTTTTSLSALPSLPISPNLKPAQTSSNEAQIVPSITVISPVTGHQYERTFVGIFVNGKEVDSFDALYEIPPNTGIPLSGQDSGSHQDLIDESLQSARYYLSISNLETLTGVVFTPLPALAKRNKGDSSSLTLATDVTRLGDGKVVNERYQVQTPLGDTEVAIDDIIEYQSEKYIALSTLKRFGISAQYHQQDLAIKLNMGWQPHKKEDTSRANSHATKAPIDYFPSKAGVLGLRVDSALSVSAIEKRPQDNQANNGQERHATVNRNTSANIGAFGYALGGVWGIRAKGYESESNVTNAKDNDIQSHSNNFVETSVDAVTVLPWDWDDWRIDNVYWAKSGNKLASRLGVNQPNSLGQGVQVSGGEFTGAMLAYSNQSITRHLAQFDDASSSLLQNTSQDYQHITGIGEAGGVAELRINGQAIARVQIRLDGRYEFLNLDVNRYNLTDTTVEVAIYAYPLAPQPLEVRMIPLGKRRSNVATKELLTEVGLGRSGNLFDDSTDYDDSDTVAHIYTEYGVNNRLAVRSGLNSQTTAQDGDLDITWHVGANVTPSTRSNVDLSYAHGSDQDLWQAQVSYQKSKLRASYQYQARQYQDRQYSLHHASNQSQIQPNNQTRYQDINSKSRHHLDRRQQLLLNYRANDDTTLSFNQYYQQLAAEDNESTYYNYTSIHHRFSDNLNAGVTWDSRDDRYSYRLQWTEDYRDVSHPILIDRSRRNSVGLTGNNDSDTLSLTHTLNKDTSLSQSISYLHAGPYLLFQGDINHRFSRDTVVNYNTDPDIKRLGILSEFDSRLNLGYSLYNNHLGWRTDWQLTHKSGISASIGYQHHYVSAIPTQLNYDVNSTLLDQQDLMRYRHDTPWSQDNYLYAKLSFDMFKSPKQPLRLGRVPLQRLGSIIVDIEHPTQPPIDTDSIRFTVDDQKVEASLLGAQATHSQYIINYVKAGDYTLALDGKNLPIEYSTSNLSTPTVRVVNYAPTSVPIRLVKTYGVSGKLKDAKEGVVIKVYRDDDSKSAMTLVASMTTSSYGYFQLFGLLPGTYTLQASGYESQEVTINDDFMLQIELRPNSSFIDVESGTENKKTIPNSNDIK